MGLSFLYVSSLQCLQPSLPCPHFLQLQPLPAAGLLVSLPQGLSLDLLTLNTPLSAPQTLQNRITTWESSQVSPGPHAPHPHHFSPLILELNHCHFSLDQLHNLQGQVQNKNGGPSFRNQEKVLQKVLKYSFPLSSVVFLSTCHGIFHLLFNAILSKEK